MAGPALTENPMPLTQKTLIAVAAPAAAVAASPVLSLHRLARAGWR